MTPGRRPPSATPSASSAGRRGDRGECSTWAAAPVARSTSSARVIPMCSGSGSTSPAPRRPGSAPAATRGLRPSTGCRCRSRTAPSSSCTASRCSSTSASPSRSWPRCAGCSRREGGSPARPHSSSPTTRSACGTTHPSEWSGCSNSAGLRAVELRPGIDGLTLIAWRLAGGHRCFYRWWGRESPLNATLDRCGRFLGADNRTLNATKLLFCGQFAFLAQRPEEPA